MDGADVRGGRLGPLALKDGRLIPCDLTAASLRRADMRHADLRGARLGRADLTRVDLNGAWVDGPETGG
jgi:uncharacterized protein YjbI with pentapeptide repeats